MQAHDGANLKKLLGMGDEGQIPPEVLDSYYAIRQAKYRVIGGAMTPAELLLVLHVAGVGVNGGPPVERDAPVPKFGKEIVNDANEGVVWVEGREYYVDHKGTQDLLPFRGRGPGGRLKFDSPENKGEFIYAKEENVRLKE
jgi:hypothetical protein